MEDFHCETFDIRLSFTLKDFDRDAFLKAAKIEDESEYIDEDGDLFVVLSFGSRLDPPKDHAHLRLVLRKNQQATATLSYHQAGRKEVDREPPNFEDCATWFAGFFRKDKVSARISAAYTFGENFAPTIALPFPLVASNKALAGLKVTGLALQYPADSPIDNAILERFKEGVYLFLNIKTEIELKKFDLFTELKKQKTTISSLIHQEKTDGGNKKTSKARLSP